MHTQCSTVQCPTTHVANALSTAGWWGRPRTASGGHHSHIVLAIPASQSKGHAATSFLFKEPAMATAQSTLPTVFSGSNTGWEGSLYAFLAEKQRRSGSNRTPDSYYRTLRHFFGSLQKSPDQVSPQDVFSFAHGVGLSGRDPSPVTVGARLACISSFFKFLIRLELLNSNPCDPVERPKPRPSAPSGLSASQVQQLLGVIPDSVKGRRDLAIVLSLVLTARRRSEVVNLKAGDISFDDSAVFYRYLGKGGVRGRRELPRPALVAIQRSLADIGKDLSSMQSSESLWQAGAGPSGVTASTFYHRFRRYLRLAGLPPSGLHVLRHTAAKLRRDVGESVESVSQFLDHSSLAVTTTYLRRLEGQRDVAWQGVATVLGLS